MGMADFPFFIERTEIEHDTLYLYFPYAFFHNFGTQGEGDAAALPGYAPAAAPSWLRHWANTCESLSTGSPSQVAVYLWPNSINAASSSKGVVYPQYTDLSSRFVAPLPALSEKRARSKRMGRGLPRRQSIPGCGYTALVRVLSLDHNLFNIDGSKIKFGRQA